MQRDATVGMHDGAAVPGSETTLATAKRGPDPETLKKFATSNCLDRRLPDYWCEWKSSSKSPQSLLLLLLLY